MAIICSITLCCFHVVAQQSKVDSAIMLFNKSIGTDKPDTSSFNAAYYLLASTVLTESQFEQIEAVASNYKNTRSFYTAGDIIGAAFEGIAKSDPKRAIALGKVQIEKFDKFNSPKAASTKPHGGGLNVEANEGDRSVFVIKLPIVCTTD